MEGRLLSHPVMLIRTLLAISLAGCALHPLTNFDLRTSASAPLLWEAPGRESRVPSAERRTPARVKPWFAMQNTDKPKRPGVKDASLRIPIERLKPDHVYEVPGTPDWIAIDEHVWVSNEPKHTVTRIDPKANAVVATISVGKEPCSGLAAGFGSLWVPNCGDPSLSRVDLKTGAIAATLPLTIGDSEGGLAAGAGSVWMMTDKKGTLARIDPATNKVVAEITVAPGSFTVAFGENAVWITSTEKNLLTRVNVFTNLVEETIAVGPKPRFLAVGEGSVWTLNQGDGTITRVDVEDEQGRGHDRGGDSRWRRRDRGRRGLGVGDVVRVSDHPHRSVDEHRRATVLRARRRRDPRRPRIRLALESAAGQRVADRCQADRSDGCEVVPLEFSAPNSRRDDETRRRSQSSVSATREQPATMLSKPGPRALPAGAAPLAGNALAALTLPTRGGYGCPWTTYVRRTDAPVVAGTYADHTSRSRREESPRARSGSGLKRRAPHRPRRRASPSPPEH